MKFIVRWVFRLVILLIVLLVAALLLKDAIAKSLAEKTLKDQTGMETRIGHFEIGILTPTVTIQDLRLFNSPEFGGGIFLSLPELHMEYDRNAIKASEFHLPLVRINLDEINIVKHATQGSNIEMLKKKLESAPTHTQMGNLKFVGIDILNVTFNQLKFTDLTNPDQCRQIQLGITNEIIRKVQSEIDLSGLITKILFKTGLEFWKSKPGTPLPPKTPSLSPPLEKTEFFPSHAPSLCLSST